MANRALAIAGVALIAVGGALAGYGATRPAPASTPAANGGANAAMASAVAGLDGSIKAARASVQSAARQLSGTQSVRAALSADKATAEDNYKSGALKFPLEDGEVIEFGVTLKGHPPIAFVVEPPNAMHSSYAGKPGSYVELMGNHVLVTEVAEVVPLDHANEQTGYVMISKPFELGPAIAPLLQAHVNGELDVGSATYAIGAGASGTTTAMPLASAPGVQLVVAGGGAAVATASRSSGKPLVAGGGGVAGLGLVLLVVGLVTGKRNVALAPQTPAKTGLTPAQFGNLETQLGSATTAMTPAPVGIDSGTSGSTANLGAGATIGRWEIIKRIGSGGMADVYLARARGEAGFEKLVAVKVMHPHLARNERAVEHFLDEARLAAQISHPNVVQILDLGKIGNDYVIVMEYVDGIDLERVLAAARAAQRPVPLDVGLGILARICDGLDAAHRANSSDGQPMHLVHRDVKSANVLVSRQGTVKVVDFGIAKAASQSHMTVAGETKGTPSMMAPEQRVGEQVDVRADVYSVAAVAYEILTGHNVNLDVAALAHLGIEKWPHLPLPSTQRAQLPIELDSIIIGALAFERERRPPSCAALGASFEGVAKRYNMAASDKDIARWVSGEMDRIAA
ncbi:MAG TPA: serine/threonine-protein kinase [Kofleriaceae bacterium]